MRKTLFLFFLFLSSISANADNFIVTSNADSGPGSLRDAILQANANGMTVADVISFNIADITIVGRTIVLLTSYPDFTSNITIDGTTQPGANIGVSNAKIRITNPVGVSIQYIFRIIHNGNIALYGLHFDSISGAIGQPIIQIAIQLHNTHNIKVGAANKGNYFTKLGLAVGGANLPYPGKGVNNGFSFKGNIVNLSEDGNTIMVFSFTQAIGLVNVRDLEIGGEQPGEGNYMCSIAEAMVFINTDTFSNINFGYARVINNKLGCNFTETAPLTCGYISLYSSQGFGYTDTTNILVKGNSFNAQAYAFSNNLKTFLKIDGKKGFFDIKGNKVGLLGNPATQYVSIIAGGISIVNCDDGIIGGDGPSDSNYVAGSVYTAIAVNNNKNVKITKNSIFCNSKGLVATSNLVSIPKTKIFTINNNTVIGTTLANGTVEVFLTRICAYCDNGKTYLGNTIADGSGNWTFVSSVILDGAVTATGTSPQGATGEFAKPEYVQVNFTTRSPTCNQNNGFIHGMEFVAGTRYYWARSYNGNYDTIYSQNLDNIGPGVYKFVVEQGAYCSVSFTVSLWDNSPVLYSQNVAITNPACGQSNGKIISHFASGSFNKIIWKDAANNIVGNTLNLFNVGPGQYKLIILDTTYGCGDSSAFYTLINQAGPSLNTAAVLVNAASCGNSNGSITGITASNVSGSTFIRWVDSLNNPVGTSLDLINVFPGKYRLKFRDASGCDTIFTPYYTILDNGGITLNSNNVVITPSKCSGNTGSIQQIQVTNGETYNWINTATNAPVGNTVGVSNLPVGNYQLIVSNSFGCTKSSQVFTLPQTIFVPIAVTASSFRDALCLQNNGFVKIDGFSNNAALYSFKWIDSVSAQNAGNETTISNLGAGNYMLYATDSNGCEKKIFSKMIISKPMPFFDYTGLKIVDDQCDLNIGLINGIVVNGLTGPTTFTWYDQNNNNVGNSINLQQVTTGVYILQVSDAGVCNIQSNFFSITNVNNALANPEYDDLLIPENTIAILTVKNPGAGIYRLYNNPTATQFIQQQATGIFSIPQLSSDTAFYVKRVNGSCESPKIKVNINLIKDSYFAIPKAFTPNADNRNDRLIVNVIGNITLKWFRIYNKWGNLVFETRMLQDSWDGYFNGKLQNTGGFIWIAEGLDFRGRQVLEKGSFVLIR